MAVPSVAVNVMLAVHEKKTTALDMYRPLRQYIVAHYSEREAVDLEEDLVALQQMREEIVRACDSLEPRRDLLLRYFRALCVVESRFPISPDKDHISALSFSWLDAIKPAKKASQQNVHFEKAAVLFNLGAVQSQIALAADRATPAGLRQACNCFMAAAGAFAFLRDNASMKASASPTTIDISAESASTLERLMLAQAQECFFEKAVSDKKPPSLCSKIAKQVGIYYEEAHSALIAPPLNQHYDRNWAAHVQLKAAQYHAEACYRSAIELHEKEEIGEEIARLKSATAILVAAKKSSRGAVGPLLDAIAKLEANINVNLDCALKENDRVYLMRVPPLSSLPPLPAASLVKSASLVDVLDASNEKMFTSIVPDSSAKALSRYTAMLDDVIRNLAEKLQQESEITRVKLKEMGLPDSLHSLEGSVSIPEQLRNEVEAVQSDGGLSGLEAGTQQLKDLRSVNEELLVQVEELIQKEASEDGQFRAQFGTRWARPQSSTLTKNFQDRMNSFAAKVKQAAEMDVKVERSIKDNWSLMSILEVKPIEAALPSLARPIMSLNGDEDAIVGSLKQNLGQLESLGSERAGLEDMLKEMKRKDNILPKLMTTSGSYDDLFKKELAKYDPIAQAVNRNVEAQSKLLQQIKMENQAFSAIFNLEDYTASRDRALKHISAAVAKYREIRDNINNEGIKFYVTLQDAIKNLKQQCSDYAMTRKIQCREMMEDLQRQLTGFTLHEGNAPMKYPGAAASQSLAQRPDPYPPSQQQQQQHPQRPTSAAMPYPPAPTHSQLPQRPPVSAPSPNPYPQYYHPHNMAEASGHLSMQSLPSVQQSQPSVQRASQGNYSSGLHQSAPSNYNPSLQTHHQSMPSYYSQSNNAPPQTLNPDYTQPPYPGWQGSYYNAPPINSQSAPQIPPPPYHMPPQTNYYPPSQGDFKQ